MPRSTRTRRPLADPMAMPPGRGFHHVRPLHRAFEPAGGVDPSRVASACGRAPHARDRATQVDQTLTNDVAARASCARYGETSQTPGTSDGARGTRTPDLLGAIQALSQLSYSPVRPACRI